MGILLLFLAFAIPGISYSQDKPSSTGASQPQSDPVPHPKSSSPGNMAKGKPGGNTPEGAVPGAITDIQIAPEDAKLTVTVATDRLFAPQEFMMKNPARLVLDFPNARNRVAFTQLPVNALSVKRIRVQQFQAEPSLIARVVLDLEEGYGAHEIDTNKESVRLVFYKEKPNLSSSTAAAELVDKSSSTQSAPLASASKPSVPAALLASTDTVAPNSEGLARTESLNPAPADKLAASGTASPRIPAIVPAQPTAPRIELPRAGVFADLNPPLPPPQAPLVASLAPSSVAPFSPAPPARFSGQPLTLDLVDMPLVDFFRLMSEEGGINVVMDPEIKGKVSIKVVKVPWDQIFESVLINNSLDKQIDGRVVRIARKSTLQDEAKQQESLKKANLLAADIETRIKRLNYAKASTFIKILDDQKTVRGTIVVEERTNSLILTDLPDSISKMIQLIEALDVPQPQVEIEARIVSATRDFARSIGIQFGFVQGNLQRVTVGGANTTSTIGGARPSATPGSAFVAGSASTGRGSADTTSTTSGAVSTGTSATNNSGNYNVNLPSTTPFGGIGVSIGNIFDTFLLDAAITAGETRGLAKLISQPKVTALNNSPAVITQGLRFPVQTIANNTVTVQFENAALTLTVTPQITYDGTIVLDLKVENNTADFSKEVNGVPSIDTSESTTRVRVVDGGTTVIGGILLDNETTEVDQVPGLGSLPLVGNLFKRSTVSRTTQEVLFFITPRVIK